LEGCHVLLVGLFWNARGLETHEAMLTKSMREGMPGVATFIDVLPQLVGDRNQWHGYWCKPVARACTLGLWWAVGQAATLSVTCVSKTSMSQALPLCGPTHFEEV